MAHIPKRTVQHSLFITGEDQPPVCLKPGQQDHLKRGIYAQEIPDDGPSYLAQELPARSEYARTIECSTQPDHYHEPRKPHRRPVFEASGGKSKGGADLWRSEYRSQLGTDSLVGRAPFYRQRGPHHEAEREHSYPGQPVDCSAYGHDFGRYGSDPRDRMRPGDMRLPVLKSELNAGTTKGTDIIPGYQGHIPTCQSAPVSARGASKGHPLRTSAAKTNMADTFHTNLVGYAGHVPTSHKNDNGGHKTSELTTTGRDFARQLFDRAH